VWYNYADNERKKDVVKMVELVLELIKVVVLMIGIILIYDARAITKKVFSFGDQNEATLILKIIGFIICIIAGILIII